MKNLYAFAMALLVAAVAVAQPPIPDIKKLPEGVVPVMDGQIDALWNSVEAIPVEQNDDAMLGDVWIKMAWNDEALFVLAYIEDTQFCDMYCGDANPWQVDRIEIFINVGEIPEEEVGAQQDNANGISGEVMGYYQFVSEFTVEGREEWVEGTPTAWPSGAATVEGYTIQDESLVIYEFMIPFDQLTVGSGEDAVAFVPDNGAEMGFEFIYYDLDVAGGERGKICWWSTESNGWEDIGGVGEGDDGPRDPIGTIKFSTDVIPPVSTPSMAATSNLTIFPNPATNSIQISIAVATEVSIIDVTGRVVASQRVAAGETSIDVTNLNNGLYFVRAGSYTGKFIKR